MGTEPTGVNSLDQQQLLRVLKALKDGDFSERMPSGQFFGVAGEIAQTLNDTLDLLQSITSEYARITREVGVVGMFGGQAEIDGLSGTWKSLTDDLNLMAVNLTCQVRDMVQVAERIAAGNSGRRVTVGAQGEMLELKESINRLVDQLSARQLHPALTT